ncbi:MAG: bis(5'-nucleosyl)-tetraphosphatase (symmetrical) YqeK [Candidatus Poribacteria bacterium]|nr:bis(5'-nucleosyl)-tetraphosphatase (symmetrical) YqeK [Candidatus Poribacteria bacterium]
MDCTLAELRAHPKSVEIQRYLSDKLSEKRFQHVLSVQEMTIDLARIHGADVWHANLAALLHDSAKWMSPKELYTEVNRYDIRLDPIEKVNSSLLHPFIGVKLAIEKFAVTELEVLEAIRNHTTGSPSMGLLSQVLYVADFAEPTRTHKEADTARELAYTALKQAVHYVARSKIAHLLEKGVLIHPNTLHTYNSTLESREIEK